MELRRGCMNYGNRNDRKLRLYLKHEMKIECPATDLIRQKGMGS